VQIFDTGRMALKASYKMADVRACCGRITRSEHWQVHFDNLNDRDKNVFGTLFEKLELDRKPRRGDGRMAVAPS